MRPCGIRPGTASITEDINGFKWDDAAWMETRKKADPVKSPMAIYEVHLGSWRKKDRPQKEGYYTYMEAAHELADYVKKMGYTHVELMGIAEHPIRRFLGLSGYRLLRADFPLRHSKRVHVLCETTSTKRDRYHP